MNTIDTVLNQLWGSKIESFNINMLEHVIYLKIIVNENSNSISYDVVIENVTGYCWVNDFYNFNNEILVKWDTIDLTSIENKNGMEVKIKIKSDLSVFNQKNIISKCFRPNLLLEIWNSVLLIQAEKVKVNDQDYYLVKN